LTAGSDLTALFVELRATRFRNLEENLSDLGSLTEIRFCGKMSQHVNGDQCRTNISDFSEFDLIAV